MLPPLGGQSREIAGKPPFTRLPAFIQCLEPKIIVKSVIFAGLAKGELAFTRLRIGDKMGSLRKKEIIARGR